MAEEIDTQRLELDKEVPTLSVFVPPSIHLTDLEDGTSYAHFTATPVAITIANRAESSANPPISGTECCMGIDEAGRGPVIGPMIYGAFYIPIELHHSLLAATYHFDDSKVLTPLVRANLMKSVCSKGSDLYQQCGWAIKSLSARDISTGMLKNAGSYNLNAQAMDATVEIIRGVIEQGVNIREIYVDTIGSPSVYQKKLERIFPTISIRVEKKADSLFPCVSAASVVAKVTRDVSCELLHEAYIRQRTGEATAAEREESWGSGYPSDSRCVNWLKSEINPLFGFGNETRFSWGTVKDMLDLKGTGVSKVDWPADQDNDTLHVSTMWSAGSESDQLRTWFGSGVGQEAF